MGCSKVAGGRRPPVHNNRIDGTPTKTGSFGPVALRRVSASGGSPVELDQGNAGWIKRLAVDAKQIYFTDISRVYALAK